jgi:ABC-type sugar transport system substrate-binding protein
MVSHHRPVSLWGSIPIVITIASWWWCCCCCVTTADAYRIGMVVKTADNEFFRLAEQGCNDNVKLYNNDPNSTCVYIGPVATAENFNPDPNGTIQALLVEELLQNQTVDGLAISVQNADVMHDVINTAGIPIVTFDSDAPNSQRRAYIGTNNHFLGVTMGKVAQQISPLGGYYASLVANDSPNMVARAKGFSDQMNSKNNDKKPVVRKRRIKHNDQHLLLWNEVAISPVNYGRDVEEAVSQMQILVEDYNVSVIGAMGCGAMWSDQYVTMYQRIQTYHSRHNNHNNETTLTIVCADDFPLQINFLSRGQVQGLVGQMPYEMGYRAAETLIQLLLQQNNNNNGTETTTTTNDDVPEVIGTNLITHLLVPLVLPKLVVNDHLIGPLHWVGYGLFGCIVTISSYFLLWIYRYRALPVVRAAQPFFLTLLVVGIVIMASALIPLSFDDNGTSGGGVGDNNNNNNEEDDEDENASIAFTFRGTAICMSVPWLVSSGFTITFAALYSKTYRITRILNAAHGFHRVTISPMDVLRPMVALFTLNVLLLTAWTIFDPLTYIRYNDPGTDGWNRVISTYGVCRSGRRVLWYAVPLMVINTLVLLLANHQAFQARRIKSEFAESKYIALAMVTFLQAVLIGLPVSYIVRDSPPAFYLTVSFLLFVVCGVLLLLIFVPKLLAADADEETQRHNVQAAIRNSLTHNSQRVPEPSGLVTMMTAADATTSTSSCTPIVSTGDSGMRHRSTATAAAAAAQQQGRTVTSSSTNNSRHNNNTTRDSSTKSVTSSTAGETSYNNGGENNNDGVVGSPTTTTTTTPFSTTHHQDDHREDACADEQQ